MTQAGENIRLIRAALRDEKNIDILCTLLDNLEQVTEGLSDGERSAEFHNTLRGFIRVWSDFFAPSEEVIGPCISSLFQSHGYPEKRSQPVGPAVPLP